MPTAVWVTLGIVTYVWNVVFTLALCRIAGMCSRAEERIFGYLPNGMPR